jgi:hypothetical protein
MTDSQKFLLNGLPPRLGNQRSLYVRKDPDSDEAFLTEEGGDLSVEVSCSLETRGRHYEFIWGREKVI